MYIERIGCKFFAHEPEGATKRWEIAQWANRSTRNTYARAATHFVRDGVNVSFDALIA